MSFYHYSSAPFILDRSHPYSDGNGGTFKPNGLWLSDETAWEEWCRGEEFALERLQHKTLIQLNMDRILLLDTHGKLAQFSADFKVQDIYPGIGRINWKLLLNHFDGVAIVPYSVPARNAFLWYYGWDCSSACVWNLEAIIQ